MRPNRDDIKQALLHSDRYVRDAALSYLQTVSVRDAEVLPLVIRAIDQYGWEAFTSSDPFDSLPQTAETLDWMVKRLLLRIDRDARADASTDRVGPGEQAFGEPADDRLEDEFEEDENFPDEPLDFDYSTQGAGTYDAQNALRDAVVTCDVHLLTAVDEQDLIDRLPEFDLKFVRARLSLISADSERCWQELQEYADGQARDHSDADRPEIDVIDVDSSPVAGEGENAAGYDEELDSSVEFADDENSDEPGVDAGDEFEGDYEERDDYSAYLNFVLPRIEVIAREPDRWRDRVLAALTENHRDVRSLTLLPAMVRLAGTIRLEAATAHIVRLLKSIDDGWEDDRLLRRSCEYALANTGTSEVAQELAAAFGRAKTTFRRSATLVLHSLRDDAAVRACSSLLIKEKDASIRELLGCALAANLAPEAIQPLRRIILGQPWRLGIRRLQEVLIGVSTLLGVSVPETTKWRKSLAVSPSLEDEVAAAAQAMLETLRRDPQFASPSYEPADWATNDDRATPERPEPIVNHAPQAGRNDPCPCGSGKKYKKCCWRKTPVLTSGESTERSPTTPLGREDRTSGL